MERIGLPTTCEQFSAPAMPQIVEPLRGGCGIGTRSVTLARWEAVRTGASGRQRTFDRLYDRFLPNKYDPPSFALKLGHKDMRLATELGRELGVPMRLANLAFAEMTEAINRGWENRDSRSPALLQLERCGLKVEVDPRRIQEVFDRDPRHEGGAKGG